MHVLMVSPEAAPFARTGGLGDVLGALPQALNKLGVRTSLVIPAYRSVLRGAFQLVDTGIRVPIQVGDRAEEASFLEASLGNGNVAYLVRADRYFDREGLYGGPEGEFPDNAERFAFFGRAALEVLKQTGADVLHAHDWQAALSTAFLRTEPPAYPQLSHVKTVFTMHNVGYQGLFPTDVWPSLGLDWSYFTPGYLEFFGRVNFLKAGAVFADAVTTVSPSYAQEIKTAEQGYGLEGVFQERAKDLVGILNGVDYEVWDPGADRYTVRKYGPRSLAGKAYCKADLQQVYGLPQRPDVPVLGMVSRLATQKGLDLIEAALGELMRRDLQVVFLGNGEARYEDFLRQIPARYPGKASTRVGFDDALAHKIEAGSDMFLMPSLYEPCGLNQIYSLRYATIPIVRATGGLKDTVIEFDPATKSGTGFLFGPYQPPALIQAVDRALAVYGKRPLWTALMRNAMQADFSWDRSAKAYVDLYSGLLQAQDRTRSS